MDNKNSQDKEEKSANEKEVTVEDNIIQILIDNSSAISLDDFQTNDKKVLSLLNQDRDIINSQYTFNGLVRKLGIHQQSLARSLHRLEDADLVIKTDFGYKLKKNLDFMLIKKSRIDLEQMSKGISHQFASFEQIIQLYIPTNVEVQEVVNRLVGKWFGNLRWIGLVEGEGNYILQWASDEKYHVNLKIISRYAVVESDAKGDRDKSEATIDASRIIQQISKLLKENEEKPTEKNNFSSFGHYN